MSTGRRVRDQPHRTARHRLGGNTFIGPVGNVPDIPTRTQPVDGRSVPCPTCGALPGEYCVSHEGVPAKTRHIARTRMATRLRNRTLDHKALAYAEGRTPRERRATRETAELTIAELAALIDVPRSNINAVEVGRGRPVREWGARYGAWLKSVDDAQ